MPEESIVAMQPGCPRPRAVLRVVGLGAVALCLGAVVLMLFGERLLANYMTSRLRGMLAEHDVAVERVAIESLGWSGSRIGSTRLVAEIGSLEWQQLQLRYRLRDLAKPRLQALEVDGLWFHLEPNWMAHMDALPLQPEDSVELPSPVTAMPPSDSPGAAVPAPRDAVAQPPDATMPASEPVTWNQRISRMLTRLPVGQLAVYDSGVRFSTAPAVLEMLAIADDLQGTASAIPCALQVTLERLLMVEDAGNIQLETALHGGPIAIEAALSAERSTGTASANGRLSLRGAWLAALVQPYLQPHLRLELGEVLEAAFWMELAGQDRFTCSADLRLPTALARHPASSAELRLDNLFALLRGIGSYWQLDGGAHLQPMQLAASAPVPLKFSARGEPLAGVGSAMLQIGYSPTAPLVVEAVLQANQLRQLDINGQLPIAEINPWLGAFSGIAGEFSGTVIGIAASRRHVGLWPEGKLAWDIAAADYIDPGGFELRGIRTRGSIHWLGWPATRERQLLQIARLDFGSLALDDLRLQWELPHIGRLHIAAAEARLLADTGAAVAELAVEPFHFDPRAVDFSASIKIRQFDAAWLFELLGEERFGLQALLDGESRIDYTAGSVIVRSLHLRKHTDSAARFVFRDRAFLAAQLAQLGNLPGGVGQRLLDALMQQGIALDSFDVDLLPAPLAGVVELRMRLSGVCRSANIELPIGGLTLRNRIEEARLLELLGNSISLRVLP